MEEDIIDEISDAYPAFKLPRRITLINVLEKVFAEFHTAFVFIMDEWDCMFRKNKKDTQAQITYLDFLPDLLKDQSYVALAYMTGILPIKKYSEHSALNMFTEISMTDPVNMRNLLVLRRQKSKHFVNSIRCPLRRPNAGMTAISSKAFRSTILVPLLCP